MKKTLVKPDLKRCQCERVVNFMTMGGAIAGQTIGRCVNPPMVIITEKEKNTDGKRGSMSLCSICRAQAEKQIGKENFTEKIIIKRKGKKEISGEGQFYK